MSDWSSDECSSDLDNLSQPPATTPKIAIVSPEFALASHSLALLAQSNSKIARPVPQIDSVQDYEVAKTYYQHSKTYSNVLIGATSISPEPIMSEQSLGVLRGDRKNVG